MWCWARVDIGDDSHVGVSLLACQPLAPLGADRVGRIGLSFMPEPMQCDAQRRTRGSGDRCRPQQQCEDDESKV